MAGRRREQQERGEESEKTRNARIVPRRRDSATVRAMKPRRWGNRLSSIWVLVCAVCAGCSDPADVDVTGSWCGRPASSREQCQGDEVEYLDLVQSGQSVSGRICEAYDKDCQVIQSGAIENGRLSFFYEFGGYRGDASFETDGDNTLRGAIRSSKCNCSVALSMQRVP